jgi:hypothetical protein
MNFSFLLSPAFWCAVTFLFLMLGEGIGEILENDFGIYLFV